MYLDELERQINDINMEFPCIMEIIEVVSKIDKMSNTSFDYDIERKYMKYIEIYNILKNS